MIDSLDRNLLYDFIVKYKNYYCDETSKKIIFEEIIKVQDIDKSILNCAPESIFITISFYDNLTDDKLHDINSLENLREVNGDSYLKNSKEIKILTEVEKEALLDNMPYENKYLYFNIQSFFKKYHKLNWNNSDDKMFIFIVADENVLFQSDFLYIQNYKEETLGVSRKIPQYAKERYLSFNAIYDSIYDDKKLSSYFEFPLTWYAPENFELSEDITNQMVNYFFKIICNKKLGDSKYLIRGHKTITIELNSNSMSNNIAKCIKELFEFILDADKHHDKLSLLRNTMTIFLDSQSNECNFYEKSEEILKAVNYNFDLYIQDKVKLFLDQKNKLLQEFIMTTKKIEDLTNALISQMKTVTLSLLGTIFLSLVNDLNRGKTHAMINLVLLSYILFFSFNLIIVINQKKQKQSLTDSLKNYTKSIGVVGDSQDNSLSYETLEQTYLKSSLEFFNNYRCWTILGLSVLILIFICLYISNRFNIFSTPIDILKFFIGY
ncbi:hypothetical protein [Enterococcus mundtii]|uniref:hypothetical protein n=1 Tax=Enterococcus mundtii TaxID=53346 RepID=UPI001A956AF6|nr:hypothetical protein [Enterococcus mundtii]MBO1087005.1 hypothetical protein [Enterococcus mundtii]